MDAYLIRSKELDDGVQYHGILMADNLVDLYWTIYLHYTNPYEFEFCLASLADGITFRTKMEYMLENTDTPIPSRCVSDVSANNIRVELDPHDVMLSIEYEDALAYVDMDREWKTFPEDFNPNV